VTDPLTAVVADDDMEIRALVARRLRGAGFRVTEAANGDEALERALDGRPDLVVLDAMMPQRDGFTVAQQLRANGLSCGILILSARGQASDLRRGYDVGADDYVIKPFDGGDLVRRALEAANRSRGAGA
jgi:DNA-binding response OmpR family regulator